MLNNHLLKKAVLILAVLLVLMVILNILEVLVVASFWFVIIACALGILLPTYLWTTYKDNKRGR